MTICLLASPRTVSECLSAVYLVPIFFASGLLTSDLIL